MDSLEIKKAADIASEIERLDTVMSEAIKTLTNERVNLVEFVIFAYDDFLSGKAFIANSTADTMINAYNKRINELQSALDKLKGLDLIRSEDLETFRSNLNAFAANEGIDINSIKTKFDFKV